MAARRLTRGELISAVSALVLTVLMFAADWYGVDSRRGITGTETGWQGLTGVRWLILVTVVVAFGAVAAHAASPTRQAVAGVRLGLLALSCATAVAVIVRVLIALPSSDRVVDQKLGGALGVIAALGIAYGAWDSVREQRARLAAGTASAAAVTEE